MTPEEMQRTMEFLLAQQARFDTSLEKLLESHARLTSSVLRVVGLVEELAKAQKATDEQLRATDERLRATDERLRATDERLRATDERLNVLISVVEKHITGPDHRRRASRK